MRLCLLLNLCISSDKQRSNLIAAHGDLDLLKKFHTLPNSHGANLAASQNHYHILEWLSKHGIYCTQKGANDAFANGHIETARWLCHPNRKNNILFWDRKGMIKASNKGKTNILRWAQSDEVMGYQRIYTDLREKKLMESLYDSGFFS